MDDLATASFEVWNSLIEVKQKREREDIKPHDNDSKTSVKDWLYWLLRQAMDSSLFKKSNPTLAK